MQWINKLSPKTMTCYKKSISFFLLASFLLGSFYVHSPTRNELKPSLSKIFEKIPEEDRLILEDFFHELITKGTFGFVLFGNKPVATSSYINPNSDYFMQYWIDPENLRFRTGMECWRKYYKLFPSKNYQFIFFGDLLKDPYIEIALVNKKKCIEAVQKNLNKFRNRSRGIEIPFN